MKPRQFESCLRSTEGPEYGEFCFNGSKNGKKEKKGSGGGGGGGDEDMGSCFWPTKVSCIGYVACQQRFTILFGPFCM